MAFGHFCTKIYYNQNAADKGVSTIMKIELLSIKQTVLIVPGSTGIIYTNQVGGTECDHPELEGFIVPIEYDIEIENPQESLTFSLCKMFPDGSSGVISKHDAEKIQGLLSQSPFTRGVTIDWERLGISKEAWVHVKINGTLEETIEQGGISEAILTWPNSD